MRGDDRYQRELFSNGSLEQRIAADHPLQRIRALADGALERLNDAFRISTDVGRPLIAPEELLRAMLLQVCGRSWDLTKQNRLAPMQRCTAPESACEAT